MSIWMVALVVIVLWKIVYHRTYIAHSGAKTTSGKILRWTGAFIFLVVLCLLLESNNFVTRALNNTGDRFTNTVVNSP